MQAGSGDAEDPITAINVTPLVDVSLVLVIIFMVTTPFMSQSKLSVTLPKAATDESKNEDHVTLTIDKDGKMNVNEKEVKDPKELRGLLSQKLASNDEKIIIIKADEGIDNGTVMDAMETAKELKPKKIYFATATNKKGMK
jgi:biopolymer transport protein ExbD